MTRQRTYQQRHIERGLCIKCTTRSVAMNLCQSHLEAKREYEKLRRRGPNWKPGKAGRPRNT